MGLFSAFDRVAIVNLPHRRDRRVETVAELRLFGERVDGRRIQFFPAVRPESAGLFPTLGARGCFLSHQAIVQQAIDDDVDRLLVLEDDVSFSPEAVLRVPPLQHALGELAWDIALLGHGLQLPADAPALPISNDSIVGSHCYALSRGGMRSLSRYLDAVLRRPPGHPEGGPMHYDGALNMWRAGPAVVSRVLNPSVAGQRSSRTDVHAHGLHDRVPLVRQATAIVRRLRNTVRLTAKWFVLR